MCREVTLQGLHATHKFSTFRSTPPKNLCYNLSMSKHQERKNTPVFRGFAMYFPNAIKYVSQVSLQGNRQHHPDADLHWDMSKSTDEADALLRHLIDSGRDWGALDDDGVLHAGKVAWRAMALLERVLTKEHAD